jgi:hypothetical protein
MDQINQYIEEQTNQLARIICTCVRTRLQASLVATRVHGS